MNLIHHFCIFELSYKELTLYLNYSDNFIHYSYCSVCHLTLEKRIIIGALLINYIVDWTVAGMLFEIWGSWTQEIHHCT